MIIPDELIWLGASTLVTTQGWILLTLIKIKEKVTELSVQISFEKEAHRETDIRVQTQIDKLNKK